MKDENQFLQGMWETVLKLEYEEQQKEFARTLNKQFIKQQIMIYACVVSIFCIVYAAYITLTLNIVYLYVCCFMALIIGYVVETQLVREIRRND